MININNIRDDILKFKHNIMGLIFFSYKHTHTHTHTHTKGNKEMYPAEESNVKPKVLLASFSAKPNLCSSSADQVPSSLTRSCAGLMS